MTCNKKSIFLVATFFLLLGIFCYAFLYPNKFHSINIGHWHIVFYKLNIQNTVFLAIIYSLTSFCHIIFMTLYSVLITNNLSFRGVVKWSLFWGIVDSVFEVMQLKESTESTVLSSYWLINKINHYLGRGHFDIWDMVVIWLAVLVIILFWRYFCLDSKALEKAINTPK